ncbi:something about silencing protein 10 [Saxophila tyrrhenica]|uniref:Something about silencing protein 10 n=1 Tax=Saxophila tyrrhenica TaxID=1690608 RepID=A0AAV9P844_9PEZI|nr:something about silencing protein 10 [Saxophila tyrrhenica]
MGKKRKSARAEADAPSGPNMDVGDSKRRIKDFEDVADSDDEFHINRDKVLLDEGPEAKRRRRDQEREAFLDPSDEEVLGHSDEEEEDEEDESEDERGDARPGARPASDSEEGDEEGSVDDDDDEEGIGWGMAKDEIYGADAIETEEQALEEEKEALRLQKKQLQGMSAADYGFDEAEWQDGEAEKMDERTRKVVTETLPQLQVSEDLGPVERLKLLRSRYPEFEPLSRELLAMKEVQEGLVKDVGVRGGERPNAQTKLRAASAYVGALTMYFALLSSPASGGGAGTVAMPAVQLRNHPVMDTLVKCRELWARASKLPKDPEPLQPAATNGVAGDARTGKADQLAKASQDVQQPKKSRAQRHAEAAQAASEARKAERLQRTEADLADLDALIHQKRSKRKRAESGLDSDAGEEAPLTAHDAAEKARRKKSLRFYTSQIAQRENKRGTAGRNAGGDEDIPYRERLKDRQARLNAEAERRGRKNAEAGADLGGASDEEDTRQARAIREEGDDYYDAIAARTAKKKSDKAAFAEAQRQAALQGGRVVPEEVVGADGKRKVTYAIEKNKGLTPHRKKESRNPRVKKRKKFDEKKKKLGSIKPVYKGGEGRGGYGGELTGIKRGLVKSTKL